MLSRTERLSRRRRRASYLLAVLSRLTCLHLSTPASCCCCVCISESCPGDRVWVACVRITALAHVESNIKRGALPCGREKLKHARVGAIDPGAWDLLSSSSIFHPCHARRWPRACSSSEIAVIPICRAWLLGWTRRRLLAQLSSREEPPGVDPQHHLGSIH